MEDRTAFFKLPILTLFVAPTTHYEIKVKNKDQMNVNCKLRLQFFLLSFLPWIQKLHKGNLKTDQYKKHNKTKKDEKPEE